MDECIHIPDRMAEGILILDERPESNVVTNVFVIVQAGGANKAREVRTPAGLPRLFKSALDWNLYSSLQHAASDRSVRILGSSSQVGVIQRKAHQIQ